MKKISKLLLVLGLALLTIPSFTSCEDFWDLVYGKTGTLNVVLGTADESTYGDKTIDLAIDILNAEYKVTKENYYTKKGLKIGDVIDISNDIKASGFTKMLCVKAKFSDAEEYAECKYYMQDGAYGPVGKTNYGTAPGGYDLYIIIQDGGEIVYNWKQS